MPINRPNSFASVGKAKMPGAVNPDGTITKAIAEDNITVSPASGQGNVTVALSVDTARTTYEGTQFAGYYHPGSQILFNWESGSTLTAGKMYYWSSLGSWQPADAGTDGENLMAMCSDNADGTEMVFKGLVQSNQLFTAGQLGQPVYLSPSGTLSTLKPSSTGEWVRLIGYVKELDGLILLDVSNDFYQVP